MPYQLVKLGPCSRPSKGEILREADTIEEIEDGWIAGKVVICWKSDAPPPKRLSPASLGSKRRKTLRTRLERKYPLFADQLFKTETNSRPDHYWPDLFTCTEDRQ